MLSYFHCLKFLGFFNKYTQMSSKYVLTTLSCTTIFNIHSFEVQFYPKIGVCTLLPVTSLFYSRTIGMEIMILSLWDFFFSYKHSVMLQLKQQQHATGLWNKWIITVLELSFWSFYIIWKIQVVCESMIAKAIKISGSGFTGHF